MSAAPFLPHAFSVLCEAYAERSAQIIREGFDFSHDDAHAGGDLARAAASYAHNAASTSPLERGRNAETPPVLWPWARVWWKPTTPRRDCIKALALLIAEVERIDRAAGVTVTSTDALEALALMPQPPLELDAYDRERALDLESYNCATAYARALLGYRLDAAAAIACAYGYRHATLTLPPLPLTAFKRGGFWGDRYTLNEEIRKALADRCRRAGLGALAGDVLTPEPKP